VTVAFNYFYQNIVQTLLEGILENISKARTITSQDLFNSLQQVKIQNLLSVIVFFVIITTLAGYIASRVTLTPARNALAAQKRFIGDIAHELRTPLSVMKTNSEVALLDEDLDPSIRKLLLSDIEELNRASEIINNLLSLNNLVRPKDMTFANIDLDKVIDSTVKKMRQMANRKELTLVVKKKGAFTVWGNQTALEQILVNLIRNAISYTPEGGRITISVESDYFKNTLLSVEDTGVGIAQKDLLHIFEPFYRAEASRSRHSGSSGLGLTIVSELVKIHSAKITIKSLVGKGTTAIVIFPENKKALNDSENNNIQTEVSIDYFKTRA
jgi:two-component system phosphate regulon sensor histidine kinase PhoR